MDGRCHPEEIRLSPGSIRLSSQGPGKLDFFPWVPHLPPIPEPTVGEDHSEIGQDTNVYTGTPAQKKAQVPVI